MVIRYNKEVPNQKSYKKKKHRSKISMQNTFKALTSKNHTFLTNLGFKVLV